jgi:hypothetical protein
MILASRVTTSGAYWGPSTQHEKRPSSQWKVIDISRPQEAKPHDFQERRKNDKVKTTFNIVIYFYPSAVELEVATTSDSTWIDHHASRSI